MLTSSGLIERFASSGPSRYSLTDGDALRKVVGAIPTVTPHWAAILVILVEMSAAIRVVTGDAYRRPDVEFARRVRSLAPMLEATHLRVPEPQGEDYNTQVIQWVTDFATGLAAGDTSVLPPRQRAGGNNARRHNV